MPRIQWRQDTVGRRRLFHWGCVIAASWIRSSCFSVQGLCHLLPTEQFWGWAGLVKCGFSLRVLPVPDPWLSKGSHWLWALHWAPEEEQPWGSRKVAQTFEHWAGLISSRWLLRARIECGAPWPSLSLPRPWTVGSVSGPSFSSSSSPRRESTQGNYCWSYQKQVLCRFFSWKSARCSAGGHNAWSILALNQKDHRKVDCMVAFTGLGGLRVRCWRRIVYVVLAVLMTFMSLLHPCVPRFWKARVEKQDE